MIHQSLQIHAIRYFFSFHRVMSLSMKVNAETCLDLPFITDFQTVSVSLTASLFGYSLFHVFT